MPIFRLPGGLGLFVDVPRAGGDAVSAYLAARFGPLAFHDIRHTKVPTKRRWSQSSPQHVDRASLERLFPSEFFAATFALVRHPAERLAHVYEFQQRVEGLIPQTTTFGEWLEDIAERLEDEPFLHDNSVRPMADLVPEGADVFRYEEGPAPVTAWLDALAGTEAGAGEPALTLDLAGPPAAVEPTPYDLEHIAEFHLADYRRFGYDLRPPARPPARQTAERPSLLTKVLHGRGARERG